MRFGSKLVVAVFASLGLLACKDSHQDAKAPEANPWADYKGTYAPGGSQDEQASTTKPKSIASATPDGADTNAAAAPAPAEEKPAKGGKPKKRGGKAARAGVAAAAPEAAAAPTPTPTTTTAAETKPAADDAKSMYGLETSTPPAGTADDSAAPPKKAPKKRAGKKAGKKPAKQ